MPQGSEPASIPRQEKAQAAAQMPVKKKPSIGVQLCVSYALMCIFPNAKKSHE